MIAPGSVWARREPIEPDDGWNRVRVTGRFEDELTVTGADAFTETITATPESLALAYNCEREPPTAEAWADGPGAEVGS